MSLRPVPAPAPPRPYTVSELLAEVNGLLRREWHDIAVVGEVSGWRVQAGAGHAYFSLKDKTGSLGAIIFASDLRRVPFSVQNGLEIVARGSLDVWAPQGRFQLKAFSIEPVGIGALQLAFEQLKQKLEAEGLFDAARKKPIPRLPRRIGIVTSPDGAALRDVLHVLKRRFDGLALTIYPVRVQGDLAAAEIAAALRAFNRRGGFDVVIVARGGGSPEDLACFNDERVARALSASRIPTISAVGHETDWTIADFVADLRAATPSGAAEMVIERRADLEKTVRDGASRLTAWMRSGLGHRRGRLATLARSEAVFAFRIRLRGLFERVVQDRAALADALRRRPLEFASRLGAARRTLTSFTRVVELDRKREAVGRMASLLSERARRAQERRRAYLSRVAGRLEVLSPLAVLARGYAVAYADGSQAPLTSAKDVAVGGKIRVRLHEGELKAVVREGGRPADFGPLFRRETGRVR
jgi:exodeoxyribonuclease VII large subunit